MDIDRFSALSQQTASQPTRPKEDNKKEDIEDIIDAEWAEVETSPNSTDPAIIHLVTQPFSGGPNEAIAHAAFNPLPFLDRLLTPWGIAGVLLVFTGNILLGSTQGVWRKTPALQPLSLAQRTTTFPEASPETSLTLPPTEAYSETFSRNINPQDGQLLDITQLSTVKAPLSLRNSQWSPLPVVAQTTPGMPLATTLVPPIHSIPSLAKYPTAPSPTQTAAIAKAQPINSFVKRSIPFIPLALQPKTSPIVPPPPPTSSLTPLPSAQAPGTPIAAPQKNSTPTDRATPSAISTTITHQLPPQSFNQRIREKLQNLSNQMPKSETEENSSIVNQIQENQRNQEN
jgi:hypothetical protein